MSDHQDSIVCPQCGMRSYNPTDVAEQYCGACHQWHDQMHGPVQLSPADRSFDERGMSL